MVEDNNEEKDLDLWQHHKSLVTALQKSNYTSDEDIKNVINSEVSQYLNTPTSTVWKSIQDMEHLNIDVS
jgi:hypothetical protein